MTTDAQFSPLKPNTGVDSHCLRFRLLLNIDATTGQPVYDDTGRIYLYGPDDGTDPCAGIIVGRSPNLGAIHLTERGRAVTHRRDGQLPGLTHTRRPGKQIHPT